MKSFLCLLFLAVCMSLVQAQRVMVIAHRGGASLAPENTLAAFKNAIDMGVDFVEMDVWNSYDDSLMVIHDNTINRTTNGTGTVTAMYYFQLIRWDAGSWFSPKFSAERIPTLRQVLTLIRGKNTKAVIEIKNTNATSNVVHLIEEMGMVGQTYIACFYIDALIEAKKINSQVSLLYLVDPVSLSQIDTVKSIGGIVIASGNNNTQANINYAHQQGIHYWPWTIDDSVSMTHFIANNVDGIITNSPHVLLSILGTQTIVHRTKVHIPETVTLSGYPNPFNPSLTVHYSLQQSGAVSIAVYDVLGQLISTLVDENRHIPGAYSVLWDAHAQASGLYLIRMQTDYGITTMKSILMK